MAFARSFSSRPGSGRRSGRAGHGRAESVSFTQPVDAGRLLAGNARARRLASLGPPAPWRSRFCVGLCAVADCGGFHRAAERLNLTQSTVSQQIKRLELETKRPLFRRTTRSVSLTDEGEMLLGDARRLLQLEETARLRLAAPRLSGKVRFGVVEQLAGGSLPSALRRFAALHSGVKLELQIGLSEDLIEQFNAGRVDVVFARRSPGTTQGRLAWREPLVWAASDTFHVIPGAALPLAFVERSFVREAALAAAQDGELSWEVVCTGLSLSVWRARRGACGARHRATSRERSHPRLAHSRCRGRPAAATRYRVRYL